MRASVAVGLLLAAASAFTQGGRRLPVRTPPPRLQWQRVLAKDGTFSVLMPGKPEYQSQTLTAMNGRPVQHTTYTVELRHSAYMASTSDYDDKTLVSLDGAIDGWLHSYKDPKVLQRRTTMLYGRLAQIVEFNSGNYRVVVHAIKAGKRIYQLDFAERRDDFLPVHVETFMKSFRLR